MQIPSHSAHPPCDPEVFTRGELIAILQAGAPTGEVEYWVKFAAKESGARLDWYTEGGYPQVMHLGNDQTYAKAIETIKAMNGLGGVKVKRTLPRGRISHFRRDR